MLEPDRDQIEIFVNALFRYATPQGFVSIRAFYEDGGRKSFRITPTSLAGGLPFLIDVAEDDARRAANDPKPVVFCPPIASFITKERAGEKDIAEGYALSVECDRRPLEAREELERLIGPATVVVRSGGIWIDPSGMAHDKLHLHWRLAKPARGEDLSKLKALRDLAARIVGGDPSNKPVCHPIRWPGSWHRKGEPRPCEIIAGDLDCELDLVTGLEILTVLTKNMRMGNGGASTGADDDRQRLEWESVFGKILSGEEYHPALVPLAASLASWGAPEPVTDNILRCLLLNSNPADPERIRRRDAELAKLPETVGSAYAKYGKTEAATGTASTWCFHANTKPEATRWLIKNLLPEIGAGLISGQWGSYKTTVALDIAVSAMTGTPLAGRFGVKRQGGVAYFAPEGSAGLESRLSAAAHARGIDETLPFAYRSDCPPLTKMGALEKLTAMVEEASKELRERFGVDTVLVFIDTIVTAAAYARSGDESDAAIGQRVMSVLSSLSRKVGALVVGVDHFGKAVETGTRGSSAKEGHADVVLALLADRELTGAVTNTRMALRKLREGIAGLEMPFTPKQLEVGMDADDEPIVRVVVDWSGQAAPSPDSAWGKSLRLLRSILMAMLADNGKDVAPFADGPVVRACGLETVRAEFCKQYYADGTPAQKADARRKAFKRAIEGAQSKGLIGTRELGGVQLIWLARPEAGRI
jgi:hypothetical protein